MKSEFQGFYYILNSLEQIILNILQKKMRVKQLGLNRVRQSMRDRQFRGLPPWKHPWNRIAPPAPHTVSPTRAGHIQLLLTGGTGPARPAPNCTTWWRVLYVCYAYTRFAATEHACHPTTDPLAVTSQTSDRPRPPLVHPTATRLGPLPRAARSRDGLTWAAAGRWLRRRRTCT